MQCTQTGSVESREHIVKQNTNLILDSPNQMKLNEIDVTISEWFHSIIFLTMDISISFACDICWMKIQRTKVNDLSFDYHVPQKGQE